MNEATTYDGVDVGPLVALDTLADLARAVVDAADQLDTAVYLPYSRDWHRPRQHPEDDGRRLCVVCDAGAVLGGLGFTSDQRFTFPPHQKGIGYELAKRISAMDNIRQGQYRSALMCLGRIPDMATNEALKGLPKATLPTWHYSSGDHKLIWQSFRQHIDDIRKRIVPALEAAGL